MSTIEFFAQTQNVQNVKNVEIIKMLMSGLMDVQQAKKNDYLLVYTFNLSSIQIFLITHLILN